MVSITIHSDEDLYNIFIFAITFPKKLHIKQFVVEIVVGLSVIMSEEDI